jgi:hypothetical protein
MEMSGQLHAPAALTPGKSPPDTHWIGGWVGPRNGLEDVKKRKFLTLPGLELWSLGRPACGQSLHRLRYPGSLCRTRCSHFKICSFLNSHSDGWANGNAVYMHFGGTGFWSRPRHRLTLMRGFVVLLSSPGSYRNSNSIRTLSFST